MTNTLMFPHITVVGAGLMGHSIAYIFAASGRKVHLVDANQSTLTQALGKITDICQLLGSDLSILENIHTTTDLSVAVTHTHLVIEAASEILAVKQAIFLAAEKSAPAHALFCSNTSAIPIRNIAECLNNSARLLGTHFWNPPHLVRLVEVVQTSNNTEDSVTAIMALLNAVNMQPVRVYKDIPGCIGNRLQHALKREAIALVSAGVCDAETIDTVCKSGFGSRLAVLGPLEQSDMVGLDLTEQILASVLPDLDNTNRVPNYLQQLVKSGNLGMKTGQGFRQWTSESADEVRNRLKNHLVKNAKENTLTHPNSA